MKKVAHRPFISIVIPLYNKEKYIGRAIQSVRAQTYGYFEVYIVNDGSTDSSAAVAEQYIDKRFNIITQDNAGVSVARNQGIKAAGADYIAFLDADDTWEKDFLSTIVTLINRFPEASLFATGYNIRNVDNRIVEKRKIVDECGQEYFILNNYFCEAYSGLPPVTSSSVCIKKKTLYQVGLFPEGIKFGEDLAVWCRIALTFRVVVSSKLCANYYRFGISNNTEEQFNGLTDRFTFSSLLQECSKKDLLSIDLGRFVEIHTLRTVALALRKGYILDAKDLLRNIKPEYYYFRYVILNLLARASWMREYAFFLLKIRKVLF